MGFNTQTARAIPGEGTPSGAVILNPIAHATPGTQFSVVIPDGTKRFTIKPRDVAELQLAYDVSFSTYTTIPKRNEYTEENILLVGTTLYLKCSGSSTVIEVITWQ